MKIYSVNKFKKQDIRKFVRFPFKLYKNTPQWAPPFVAEMVGSLQGKHPFFQHSEADFFLAEENGQTVGRLAVLDNQRANAFRGTRAAFFGFFDVVEHQDTALGVFEAAFDWARSRGLETIIGPRGLIGSDSGGILVEGFEHRSALGVPYNFPYYDAFIKAAGFTKDTDHLSGYLPGNHIIPDRIKNIAEKKGAKRLLD